MRMLRRSLLLAALVVAAPAAAQDTIRTRDPVTVIPIPDTVPLPPLPPETVYLALDTMSLVRNHCFVVTQRWFSRTDTATAPCADFGILDSVPPVDPPTDTMPTPPDTTPTPPDTVPDPPTDSVPDDPDTDLPVIYSNDFSDPSTAGDFFEYSGFTITGGQLVGVLGPGESGGSAKLGIGAVPQSYFAGVGDPDVAYTDLRWCATLTVEGASAFPYKFGRAAGFYSPDHWGEAFISHTYTDPPRRALEGDPVSTVVNGRPTATRYNDFARFRYLGAIRTTTDARDGQPHRICTRQKLNTLGRADGLLEISVDGTVEARSTDVDWRGTWDGYGWNAVFLESFYNDGAPTRVTMRFDDFEVRGTGAAFGGTVPPDTVPAPPTDTVPTPPPGPPPAGDQVIDWSDYASAGAFFSGPGSQTSPSGGRYEIVTVTPPAGQAWTRAMRMTFLASQSTSDMGVGFRDYPISGRPRELWIEYYVRFQPGFTTSGPESGGTDWKHLFLFDQAHSGSWRWALHLGVYGSETQLRLSGETPLSPRASDIFDGSWHRFRLHARMDSPGRWCFQLDSRSMECQTGNTNRGASYYFNDFSIGRAFNKGVARDQWYELGPVSIYTSDPGW